MAYKLEQEIAVWDPAGIPNATADPFKTLFVARIVIIFYFNFIYFSLSNYSHVIEKWVYKNDVKIF